MLRVIDGEVIGMRLRLGSLLVIGSALTAISVVIACQPVQQRPPQDYDEDPPAQAQEPKEPKADPEGEQTSSQATPSGKIDNSCLGKANLAFDDVACNKCMSDTASCCQATITCFNSTPDCAFLHGCMLKCASGGGGGGGDGGGGGGGGGGDGGGGGGGGGAGLTIFTTDVFPALNPTCGTGLCHALGTNGAPIYYAATAADTYPLFKARGFHLLNSNLVNKGAHGGPALTALQRAAVDKWVAAEPQGGTGTPAPGGGSQVCKDACIAQYKGAETVWKAYNTCAAVTCKTDCL